MENAFLVGLMVSLVATFPVGIVTAIAIARILKHGYRSGFFTLLGSSFADVATFFVILSGFSHGFIHHPSLQKILTIFSSAVIILIGISIVKGKLENKNLKNNKVSDTKEYIGDFISGFVITLLNPYQIVMYSVFIASLGIHYKTEYMIKMFSFGAFLGSFIWTVVIPYLIVKLKEKYTETIKKFYPILGYMIILLGIFLLIRTVFHLENLI